MESISKCSTAAENVDDEVRPQSTATHNILKKLSWSVFDSAQWLWSVIGTVRSTPLVLNAPPTDQVLNLEAGCLLKLMWPSHCQKFTQFCSVVYQKCLQVLLRVVHFGHAASSHISFSSGEALSSLASSQLSCLFVCLFFATADSAGTPLSVFSLSHKQTDTHTHTPTKQNKHFWMKSLNFSSSSSVSCVPPSVLSFHTFLHDYNIPNLHFLTYQTPC